MDLAGVCGESLLQRERGSLTFLFIYLFVVSAAGFNV